MNWELRFRFRTVRYIIGRTVIPPLIGTTREEIIAEKTELLKSRSLSTESITLSNRDWLRFLSPHFSEILTGCAIGQWHRPSPGHCPLVMSTALDLCFRNWRLSLGLLKRSKSSRAPPLLLFHCWVRWLVLPAPLRLATARREPVPCHED